MVLPFTTARARHDRATELTGSDPPIVPPDLGRHGCGALAVADRARLRLGPVGGCRARRRFQPLRRVVDGAACGRARRRAAGLPVHGGPPPPARGRVGSRLASAHASARPPDGQPRPRRPRGQPRDDRALGRGTRDALAPGPGPRIGRERLLRDRGGRTSALGKPGRPLASGRGAGAGLRSDRSSGARRARGPLRATDRALPGGGGPVAADPRRALPGVGCPPTLDHAPRAVDDAPALRVGGPLVRHARLAARLRRPGRRRTGRRAGALPPRERSPLGTAGEPRARSPWTTRTGSRRATDAHGPRSTSRPGSTSDRGNATSSGSGSDGATRNRNPHPGSSSGPRWRGWAPGSPVPRARRGPRPGTRSPGTPPPSPGGRRGISSSEVTP